MAPDEQVSLLGGTRNVFKISEQLADNVVNCLKHPIITIRPISLQKQTAISLNLTRLLAGFFLPDANTTKPCFPAGFLLSVQLHA